jgi:hypothetical protein
MAQLVSLVQYNFTWFVRQSLTGPAWNIEGLHTPTKPYTLLDFDDESVVASCKTMADRAVGGYSTAKLDYVPADPSTNTPAHARFHGSISTKLPPNWRIQRTGMFDLNVAASPPSNEL